MWRASNISTSVPRYNVDIQITDHQNIDIKIVDQKMATLIINQCTIT
jgi:hypothetical protein